MTELDVTVTDYLITLISIGFVWNLAVSHEKKSATTPIWILLFLSIGLSSLLGGTLHGFCFDETSLCNKILWTATLLSIGITTTACWILGGCYLLSSHQLSKWIVFVIGIYLIYSIIVIFFNNNFSIAIYNYLPAMIFLLIANIITFLKNKTSFCLWIITGIIISFIAAYVQQSRFSLHPIYFNYNSTYHVIQIIALFLIFKGVKRQFNLTGNK